MSAKLISNVDSISVLGDEIDSSQVIINCSIGSREDINPGVLLVLDETRSTNTLVMNFEDFKNFILRGILVLSEKDETFKNLLEEEHIDSPPDIILP